MANEGCSVLMGREGSCGSAFGCRGWWGSFAAGGSGLFWGAHVSLLSELALEDLTAGTVLVPEAELGSCVEDILKVLCLLWVRKRAGLSPGEKFSVY